MNATRTTLSRAEYDARIAELIGALIAPEAVDDVMRRQYPKAAALAEAEIEFRGAFAGRLIEAEYTADQLDALVEHLEADGRLTVEGLGAQARGWPLAEFRRKHGGDPSVDGDLITYARSGTPFSL